MLQAPLTQVGQAMAVLQDCDTLGLLPAPSAAHTESPTVNPAFWHVTDRVCTPEDPQSALQAPHDPVDHVAQAGAEQLWVPGGFVPEH